MSIGIHGVPGLWIPMPAGTSVGDGTAFPFKLTPGKMLDSVVKTKSWAISSPFGTGNSGDRHEPSFAVGSLQSYKAFLYGAAFAFSDNIPGTGSNNVFFVLQGPMYFNPADGLFYPSIGITITDSMAATSSTFNGGGGTTGTARWWGVTVNLYGAAAAGNVIITQNTAY